MNKDNIIKSVSLALLILSVSLAPFLGIGILFGLAGSTQSYYIMIALGYLGVIIFSLVSIFKQKFFSLVVLSVVLLVTGLVMDQNFWTKHNNDFCAQLRAEPACTEDACGFNCSDFNGEGIGLTTSYEVCADKPAQLCTDMTLKEEKKIDNKNDILDKFANIVLEIVNSSNPQSLNLENDRVAIYNCFQEMNEDGENSASNKLKSMNLSSEQLSKYYDYLAMHGQNVNRQMPRPVAALPAGDPNLSCDDLGL